MSAAATASATSADSLPGWNVCAGRNTVSDSAATTAAASARPLRRTRLIA
jgi:hypothetical protein